MEAREAAIRELARRELARRELARRAAMPEPPSPREEVGAGQTLQIGPLDTGIPLPQSVTEALAGLGRRMTDIGTLGTAERSPEADKLLNQSVPAMVGGAVADIGAMALGGTALKAASALPKLGALATAGQALSAPKSLTQAVTAGAAYGAATGPDRTQEGMMGAVGGGLGYGIPKTLGRMLKPSLDPAAEALLRNNVKLTIGETFGGWVKRLEDGATSLLGVGDMIRHAKQVSLADFNRAVFDEVLSPVGMKIDDTMPLGNMAFQEVDKILRQQYENILPQLNAQADLPFLRSLGKLQTMARGGLPESTARQFDDIINTHVMRPFKNPTSTGLGESIKEVDSFLGQLNRTYSTSSVGHERQLGNAIGEVQKSIREMLARQNPNASSQLRRIDAAYARFKVLEQTMARQNVQARDGVFTPNDLLAGVKAKASKNRFAKGRALLQRTAQNASQVIPSVTPNSGTMDRAAISALLVAPGMVVNAPGTMATMGLGMAAYSQPGQNLLRMLSTQRTPGMLQAGQSLIDAAPALGMLSTAGAINVPQ